MFTIYLSYWPLPALLTLLLQTTAAINITSPQTVEVDMIFPHNDTYAPSPLFPIVFAVQNSHFAGPLSLSLSYTIWNSRTRNATSQSSLDLTWANFSSSEPYFAFDASTYITVTEGWWNIVWDVGGANCSGSPQNMFTFREESIIENNGFFFTRKKGAQQPNIVTGTSPETCANFQPEGFAWNITHTVDVPLFSGLEDAGVDRCAVLSPTSPSPAPSPCQVHVSKASASSMMASMSSEACKLIPPVVSCPSSPTKNSGASSGPMQFLMTGTLWWIVGMGWFVYGVLV